MTVHGKEFSGKAVQDRLNRNYDEERFIQEYGFTGLEELRKYIKILYNYNTKDVKNIFSRMKSNRKKKRKNTTVTETLENQKTMEIQEDSKKTEVIQNVNNINSISESDKTQVQTKQDTESTKANKVDNREATTQTTIPKEKDKLQKEAVEANLKCDIDKHKEELTQIYNKRLMIKDSADKAQATLKETCKRLEALQEEVLKLKADSVTAMELLTEKKAEYNKITAEINAKTETLRELEDALKKIQSKTLFCGSTADSGKYDFYIDSIDVEAKEVNKKASELMMAEEFGELIEEFSLKQVKKLAKIVLVYDTIKSGTDNNVKLFFEEQDDFAAAVEAALEVCSKYK